MAQLSDDCFAFGGPLLSVDDVERLMFERVEPVPERETVRLEEAAGRVLADDLMAPIDLPPFDNSAVDGYAVSMVVRPVRRTAVAVFNPGTADPAPFADRLLDIVAP